MAVVLTLSWVLQAAQDGKAEQFCSQLCQPCTELLIRLRRPSPLLARSDSAQWRSASVFSIP